MTAAAMVQVATGTAEVATEAAASKGAAVTAAAMVEVATGAAGAAQQEEEEGTLLRSSPRL